jgi:hypothetical protein
MTPSKVNNPIVTDSSDTEMDEMPDKELHSQEEKDHKLETTLGLCGETVSQKEQIEKDCKHKEQTQRGYESIGK